MGWRRQRGPGAKPSARWYQTCAVVLGVMLNHDGGGAGGCSVPAVQRIMMSARSNLTRLMNGFPAGKRRMAELFHVYHVTASFDSWQASSTDRRTGANIGFSSQKGDAARSRQRSRTVPDALILAVTLCNGLRCSEDRGQCQPMAPERPRPRYPSARKLDAGLPPSRVRALRVHAHLREAVFSRVACRDR